MGALYLAGQFGAALNQPGHNVVRHGLSVWERAGNFEGI